MKARVSQLEAETAHAVDALAALAQGQQQVGPAQSGQGTEREGHSSRMARTCALCTPPDY